LLGSYWLLLVLATHWPNPWPRGKGPEYPDKLVHFTAYAVLAFLVVPISAAKAKSAGRRRQWTGFLAAWIAVATWGLVDEATQPLTDRDFEWLDWLADCIGAVCGLAIGSVWFQAIRIGRFASRPQPPATEPRTTAP
jgi:VanZ family protein